MMTPTLQQLNLANSDYVELRKFICNADYMAFIVDNTSFLEKATVKQRLWHVLNSEHSHKLCKCGNILKWNTKNNSYRVFCSSKCAHTDESVKLKTKQTCLARFGSETNLTTDTAKKNYAIKMIDKYGIDNPFKSATVQQQIRDNIFTKYGVTSMSKLDSVKEKINQSHLARYGRLRECQTHFTNEAYEIKYDKQKLIELYDVGVSIKDIAKKLNVGHSQLCVQFKAFGIEVHRFVGQLQVLNFIKSIYGGEIVFNNRQILDGKEIDIFIPSLNIGFEYDGIFWHSQESSGKMLYHLEKDALASSKGIKLIHILDLEWNNKQDLVKSRIASLLGCNKTIYGRKTKIKILDREISSDFFNKNHIQGNANASFCVGLELDEQLVAAMSFGKSRYNSSQFELIRFCNLQNHTVVGGASKLFKFATEYLNAQEIMSFSDLRWGSGKLYSILGFDHIRDNAPSYIYTHQYRTLENRIKYQKHKLEKLLPIFDDSLSEWENMKINGYDRYWNSGNAVYKWKRS